MKITVIAAKLRKTAVDMELKAARDGDLDFPDELVLPFIINAVTDKENRRIGETSLLFIVPQVHEQFTVAGPCPKAW